jgi:hypothetical protein
MIKGDNSRPTKFKIYKSKYNPSHFYAYVVVYFCVRLFEVGCFVRFIDIGGIVDHHCLSFLFIIKPVEVN